MKTYRDDVISFMCPEHLNKNNEGYLFEGPSRGQALEMLTIEICVTEDSVRAFRRDILKSRIKSHAAEQLTLLRRGESGIRPNLIERVVLARHKIDHRTGYYWDLLFTVGERFIYMSIVKTPGEFERDRAEWEEMIRSFAWVDENETAVAAIDERRDLQDDGDFETLMTDDLSPHLVLPLSACSAWKGLPPESECLIAGIIFNPFALLDPKTDFGRALRIDGDFDLIPVGDGFGLVLGEALLTAGKSITTEGRVLIASVGDITGNEDELLRAALETQEHDGLIDTGRQWKIPDSELVFLYAGDVPDSEAPDQPRIRVKPGTYDIFHARLSDDSDPDVPLNLLDLRLRT